MILPVLGMFGLFGETYATEYAANEQLSLQVVYATRYRYKMTSDLRVSVTNLDSRSPLTLTVAFDRDYLDQFSNADFIPAVTGMTGEAVEVELPQIESGQTRVIEVELQGEQYWRHTGIISASTPGGQPIQLEVSTTIYP